MLTVEAVMITNILLLIAQMVLTRQIILTDQRLIDLTQKGLILTVIDPALIVQPLSALRLIVLHLIDHTRTGHIPIGPTLKDPTLNDLIQTARNQMKGTSMSSLLSSLLSLVVLMALP